MTKKGSDETTLAMRADSRTPGLDKARATRERRAARMAAIHAMKSPVASTRDDAQS